jgi:hypothetical protein
MRSLTELPEHERPPSRSPLSFQAQRGERVLAPNDHRVGDRPFKPKSLFRPANYQLSVAPSSQLARSMTSMLSGQHETRTT